MTFPAGFIEVNDVVMPLRAHDIADAAAQLLGRTLPPRGFAPEEVRRLIDAVIAREREIPTTCGESAIPHARDASISDFIGAIAINPNGVIEGEAQPRVIIAFLSPESKRAEHLALLAALSRLSRDRGALDALAAAKTPADVVALLQR